MATSLVFQLILITAVYVLFTTARPITEEWQATITTIQCTADELVSFQCPLEKSTTTNSSISDSPQWLISGDDDIEDTTYSMNVVERNGSLLVLYCSDELVNATLHCVLPPRVHQKFRIVMAGQNSSFLTEVTRGVIITLIVCSGLIFFAVVIICCWRNINCCWKNRKAWRKKESIFDDESKDDKFKSKEETDGELQQRQHARIEQENKERDIIETMVHDYLSATGSYTLSNKLKDLGCRLQKHWFLIRSTSNNETLLLTILPVSRNCALQLNSKTVGTLDELLAKERPSYIQVVHKIDYIPSPEPGSGYVIIIQDWHPKGSLRDTLQGLDPKQDWVDLRDCGNPLPVDKVACYGRQILEALLYLNEEGFPPLIHVHCGNIYIDDDGTVRVGGYENTLLGYRTRLYRTFHDKDSGMKNWNLIDVFLFGHVIYEMATGQSLKCAIPTDEEYSAVKDEHVTEILKYIFHFNQKKKYSLPVTAHNAFEKIIRKKDFFKDQGATLIKTAKRQRKIKHSKNITSLLQCVKKGVPVQQDDDDDYVARMQHIYLQHKTEHAEKIVRDYLAGSQCYTSLDDSGNIQRNKFTLRIKSRFDGIVLLLTMLPVPRKCALQLNSNTTINTLNQYFKTLVEEQPPYIHIVHKIDYIPPTSVNDARGHVIIIQDWYPKGSLRSQIPDQILSSLAEEASETTPLCTTTTNTKLVEYGSQILEALLFFTEKEFPPLAHVHCGNIYIDDDDTVRVGGYENTLLGYRTRLYRTFHDEDSKMRNRKLIDVFLFGHVMYEMATGQSLQSAIPTDEDYSSVGDEEVAEILKYIFHFNKPRYFWQSSISAEDALKEIRNHEFFKNCDGKVKRSKQCETDVKFKSLLKQVEKGEPVDMTAITTSQELVVLTD